MGYRLRHIALIQVLQRGVGLVEAALISLLVLIVLAGLIAISDLSSKRSCAASALNAALQKLQRTPDLIAAIGQSYENPSNPNVEAARQVLSDFAFNDGSIGIALTCGLQRVANGSFVVTGATQALPIMILTSGEQGQFTIPGHGVISDSVPGAPVGVEKLVKLRMIGKHNLFGIEALSLNVDATVAGILAGTSGAGTGVGLGIGTGSGSGTGSGTGAGTGSGTGGGVGSGTGVGAGSGAGIGSGVGAGTGTGIAVGSGVGAGAGAGTGSGIGVGVGTGTGIGVGSGSGAGVGTGSGVGVGINVGVGAGTGAGAGAGAGSGIGSGTGAGLPPGTGGQPPTPFPPPQVQPEPSVGAPSFPTLSPTPAVNFSCNTLNYLGCLSGGCLGPQPCVPNEFGYGVSFTCGAYSTFEDPCGTACFPQVCGVLTPEPFCGDGVCLGAAGENCFTCAADCGLCPVCGNGLCEGGETCPSCPDDCAPGGNIANCPGCNGIALEAGDTCWTCPQEACAGGLTCDAQGQCVPACNPLNPRPCHGVCCGKRCYKDQKAIDEMNCGTCMSNCDVQVRGNDLVASGVPCEAGSVRSCKCAPIGSGSKHPCGLCGICGGPVPPMSERGSESGCRAPVDAIGQQGSCPAGTVCDYYGYCRSPCTTESGKSNSCGPCRTCHALSGRCIGDPAQNGQSCGGCGVCYVREILFEGQVTEPGFHPLGPGQSTSAVMHGTCEPDDSKCAGGNVCWPAGEHPEGGMGFYIDHRPPAGPKPLQFGVGYYTCQPAWSRPPATVCDVNQGRVSCGRGCCQNGDACQAGVCVTAANQ